jgi:hypothetical protein
VLKVCRVFRLGGLREGQHPFPFRTGRFHPLLPMILRLRGKVGVRQDKAFDTHLSKEQNKANTIFMNWRLKRQLVIFIIFVAAFVLAGIFLFDSGKGATCFDGRQNGDEFGVDCGGSCPLACATDTKPLLVRFARPFKAAAGVYNAVAYVENPNPRAAIFQTSYEFRLYDDRDILIAERVGKTFIPPNNRIAIFETDIRALERVPVRAAFRFLEEPQWVQIDPRITNLPVSISEQNLLPGALPRLSAILRNDSVYTINNLTVAAILYDATGNAVAASKTLVDSASRKVDIPLLWSWNEPFAAPVVRIEIIPQIDVFGLRL